jgi:hypothetical protein
VQVSIVAKHTGVLHVRAVHCCSYLIVSQNTIRNDDDPFFNHIIIILTFTETAGYLIRVLIYFLKNTEIIW